MRRCVICLKPEAVKRVKDDLNLLEAQCSVIFFLKELLNCDTDLNLEELLVKHGNPSDWIQFCTSCSKLVEEGRRVHILLQQLQSKLQGIKDNFVESVKKTKKFDNEDHKNDVLMMMVRKEIIRRPRIKFAGHVRQFTNDDVDENASWPNLDALAKVKVEMDTDIVDEGDVDYFEGFLAPDCDMDDDDDDQLDNVIYPESGHCLDENDGNGEIQGEGLDFENSDSDEEYIPKAANTKTKNKLPKLGIEQGQKSGSDDKKRNGPRKTPPEARTCPICSLVLDKPSLVQRHIQVQHTRMAEVNCSTCGKGFLRKDYLKTHNLICPNRRKDESEAVGRKMDNDSQPDCDNEDGDSKISDLEDDNSDNKKLNSGPRKSAIEVRTCPICHQIFDRPSFLAKHLRSKNFKNGNCGGNVDTDVQSLTCPVCSAHFESKSLFSAHFQSHTTGNNTKELPESQPIKIISAAKIKSVAKISRLRKRPPLKSPAKKLVHYDNDDDDNNMSEISCPISDLEDDDDQDSPYNSDSEKKKKKQNSSNNNSVPGLRKSPLEVRTCPICTTIFDRPSFLAKHLRSRAFKNGNCGGNENTDVQSLTCPVCSKDFESKSLFSKHFQSHTTFTKGGGSNNMGSRPLWSRKIPESARTCPHCGHVFSKRSKLKLHLATKHKEVEENNAEPLLCSYCPKTFANKSYLKDHEWFHLSPDEKLSYVQSMRSKVPLKDKTCPVCHHVFLSNSKMRVHLNSKHIKNPLWNCEVCSKGFTRKDSYEDHLKVHLTTEQREQLLSGVPVTVPSTQTPEKSVTLKVKVRNSGSIGHRTCPTCSKVFSNRSRMNIHLKTVHEKSTSTICEICGVSIGCKQTLRNHMKNHEKEPGIKDWLCSICSKGFRHKYSLRRHQILTHNPKTDLRKFPCPIGSCQKAYPFHSLLVQHQKARKHFPHDGGDEADDDESTSNQPPTVHNNNYNNNTTPSNRIDTHQHSHPGTSFSSSSFVPPTQSYFASTNWNIF